MHTRPFHYAFYVRDLDATRRFYGTLLGCREEEIFADRPKA